MARQQQHTQSYQLTQQATAVLHEGCLQCQSLTVAAAAMPAAMTERPL
jgi:uncharacterized phage protein gp47/JayE